MRPNLPVDPRLINLDNEIIEVCFEEFKRSIDLAGIHLRDARNILVALERRGADTALAKAALLLAAAALESNLVYLSRIALKIAEMRPKLFLGPQVRYLRGTEETISDDGQIVERPLRQSLGDRLRTVPALLARGIGRKYVLRSNNAPYKKLLRAIERRDAIVHPRWDRYVSQLGWWEAAEAIDSVELYLNSIASALHPYLASYFGILYTIPGHDHHEVDVGHRTFGKRGPNYTVATMGEVGVDKVLVSEWRDSLLMLVFALDSKCEGDSEGSMLTRAALVMLYAMLDAELSVVAQWKMLEKPDSFKEPEILFLAEYAVGVGHDGEVWGGEDHQSFKKRVKAIPAILSRRVDGADASVDLGREWGRDLLNGNNLRNKVMHSPFGEPLCRVTKKELSTSAQAIFAYFEELAAKLPTSFGYMTLLLPTARDMMSKLPAI